MTNAKRKTYHHGDLKNALIDAGVRVLSREGPGGLSLRRVALEAGVSHAAPYAHFADKQALIAAISTAGYRRLYEAVSRAIQQGQGDPAAQLARGAWAYVRFALNDPDHFKVTMSGVVEREKDYPAFVEMSRRNLTLLVETVRTCQARGVLNSGPPDLVAISLWALIHGFVSLLLEDQIPKAMLDRCSLRQMLLAALNQMTRVELTEDLLLAER